VTCRDVAQQVEFVLMSVSEARRHYIWKCGHEALRSSGRRPLGRLAVSKAFLGK